MPHQALTPHVSGTTLSAQTRYANATIECLEGFFAGKRLREEYIMAEPTRS